MKKSFSLVLALTIIFSLLNTFAYSNYNLIDETKYIDGLEIKNIRSLTDDGWLNINIAKADLNKDYLDVKLLKNTDDVRKLTNVLELSNTNDSHIAVNGDFFLWASEKGMGSSVGVEIKDGELLTSYTKDTTSQAVFLKDNDKNMLFDYVDTYMTITAPNGKGEVLKHINKYDDLSGIVMYNRLWGEKSPGSYSFQVEMVVEDDIVKSINYDKGPCEIPENGYVLSFLSDRTTFLIDNFNVGDKISIDINVEPDYENINLAMGGGTLLVKDGKIAPVTHNISGIHPRTAMGLDESGKTLYLITIDGRIDSSVGVSLNTLSQILIENGIYNAINLDGGGSTTMVAKDVNSNENKLINTPSDGGMRNVINAVGIEMTKEKGAPSYLEISFGNQDVYLSSQIEIKASLYDENGQNLGNVPIKDVLFECDNGKVENGIYYPEREGNASITATYKGIETIKIFDVKKGINLKEKNKYNDVKSDKNSFKFTVFGNTSFKNTIGEMGIKRILDKKAKDYEMALIVGDKTEKEIENVKNIKSGAFSTENYKDITFISVNNKGKSISANDFSQWQKLIMAINNAKNNIFIVFDEVPEFEDKNEKDLFDDLVKKLLSKKNTFIIYKGEGEIYEKNGVAYFGVRGVENITKENILDTQHVVFVVDNTNVSYTLEKIVNK